MNSFSYRAVCSLDELTAQSCAGRYGYIETQNGRLRKIQFRLWPKLISSTEAIWIGGWKHRRKNNSGFRLFFNQPMWHPQFLTIAYAESGAFSSFANLNLAMQILDLVALLKRSDALLCELTNPRISNRLMDRWGWEPHLPNSRKRHWIKRFYGDYSGVSLANNSCVSAESAFSPRPTRLTDTTVSGN